MNKQALTEPTLEELKQSIIDRLNEFTKTEWKYDECHESGMVMFECQGASGNGYYAKYDNIVYSTRTNEYIFQTNELPLDLAHDITTYFVRLRDSEWKRGNQWA